ncbi:MAG: hypothetical protein HY538_02485 [Deltaproteobacteria bacterium]|nr:hypothetical protein [Deltaproteobacteria bacterium]
MKIQSHQEELFSTSYTHQETSKEAAESLRTYAKSLALKTLHYIQSQGSYGATCWDIEKNCRMRHQTASARIRDLVKQGRIRDSGMRRETESGRRAIVWLASYT